MADGWQMGGGYVVEGWQTGGRRVADGSQTGGRWAMDGRLIGGGWVVDGWLTVTEKYQALALGFYDYLHFIYDLFLVAILSTHSAKLACYPKNSN